MRIRQMTHNLLSMLNLKMKLRKRRFSKDFKSSSTQMEARILITSQISQKMKVKMRTLQTKAVNQKVSMIQIVIVSAAHTN